MEMKPNNANVFICSVENYDKQLKYYGEGSLSEISLLKLLYKYAGFSPSYDCLNRIDAMISNLQQSDKNICTNMIAGQDFAPSLPGVDVGGVISGTTDFAVTVTGASIVQSDEIPVDRDNSGQTSVAVYTKAVDIALTSFTTGFTDTSGFSEGDVVIVTVPSTGILKLNNVDVVNGQVIANADLGSLSYWKITNAAVSESLVFSISNNNLDNTLWSPNTTISLTVAPVGNSAISSLGDSTMYVDNNVITILTSDMFTSQLSPAYADPDGDLLDAIRIDEVSGSNQGTFLYNSGTLVIGQVITKAELDAGLFTHTGATASTITSDVILFSARDTGSLIWVS